MSRHHSPIAHNSPGRDGRRDEFVDHDDLEAIITPQGDETGIAVKTS
ncbi:hypothetical protein [Natrinema amylolyticum]|nr:hypothetical protein [Natrinema amylolyticum]